MVRRVGDRQRHEWPSSARRQDADPLRGPARADVADRDGAAALDNARLGVRQRRGGRGRDVEGRRDRAVVRAPRHAHVHVRPAGLAHEPARERRRRAARGHPVDAVERLAAPDPRRRGAGGPGEAGPRDGIGVSLPVGVAEAGPLERGGHRPAQRVLHLRPDGGHRRRPVEVRRGVEVAGQEGRHAGSRLARERAEVRADLAQPRGALVLQHLRRALAVAHELRAIWARGQVDVADRGHAARPHRHVSEAHAAALDGVDRIAGDHMQRLVGVRQSRRVGDPPQVPLWLLYPDHVRAGGLDGVPDTVEVDLYAAVPDVEGHDGERLGGRGRRERQRGERGHQRGESPHRSTSACSGCQFSFTRWPISQRSSERWRAAFCSSATSRTPGASSTITWVVVPT